MIRAQQKPMDCRAASLGGWSSVARVLGLVGWLAATACSRPLPTRAELHELRQAVEQQHAVLLDVRDSEAFAIDRLPGAINIPFNEVEKRADELPANRLIVCYCQYGQHSADVVEWLNRHGYRALWLGAKSNWNEATP